MTMSKPKPPFMTLIKRQWLTGNYYMFAGNVEVIKTVDGFSDRIRIENGVKEGFIPADVSEYYDVFNRIPDDASKYFGVFAQKKGKEITFPGRYDEKTRLILPNIKIDRP